MHTHTYIYIFYIYICIYTKIRSNFLDFFFAAFVELCCPSESPGGASEGWPGGAPHFVPQMFARCPVTYACRHAIVKNNPMGKSFIQGFFQGKQLETYGFFGTATNM